MLVRGELWPLVTEVGSYDLVGVSCLREGPEGRTHRADAPRARRQEAGLPRLRSGIGGLACRRPTGAGKPARGRRIDRQPGPEKCQAGICGRRPREGGSACSGFVRPRYHRCLSQFLRGRKCGGDARQRLEEGHVRHRLQHGIARRAEVPSCRQVRLRELSGRLSAQPVRPGEAHDPSGPWSDEEP